MTREEGVTILRAVIERGEHFDPKLLHEAVRIAASPSLAILDDKPPRTLRTAPTGCAWERPAAGWVDLARAA